MAWRDWENWQKASTIIGVLSGGAALILTISGGFKSLYDLAFPSPPWSDTAQTITIEGILATHTKTKSQKFVVDRTNDSHETFGTNVKCYDLEFAAYEGYKIVDHSWTIRSATRQSDFSINNDGGKKLKVHFCLKAGPKTDRYRGWLKGDIVTSESRNVPETAELITTLTIDKSGNYTLPAKPYSNYSSIIIRDSSGSIIGSGNVGNKIKWGDTCGSLQIVDSSERVSLEAICK